MVVWTCSLSPGSVSVVWAADAVSAAGHSLGPLMCRSARGRIGSEEVHLSAGVSDGLI